MASALHLGTHSGYYRFEREGGSWVQTGRALTFWSLSCVAVDADQPGLVYVGTERSGIFVSSDRGLTWARPNPNVPRLGTASLLAGGNDLFVGTSPAALYRRGSEGWDELEGLRLASGDSNFPPNPELGARTRYLAHDPDRAGFLYAGIEVGGMLVSEDGGSRWELANEGLSDPDVHQVLPSRRTAGLAIAACGEEGLFRTTDRGAHWNLVTPEGPRSYGTAVTEDRDGRLYAGLAHGRPATWVGPGGADAAIFRSEDGGQHWQPMVDRLEGGVLDLCSAPDSDGVFAATSDGDLLELGRDGCQGLATGLPCISALTVSNG